MAAHTWPDQIRFKKLHLTVRNSVWLQQLTFLKPTLLAKLNERAGTELVTEIALRVGEIPSRDRQSIPAAHPNDAPAVNEAAQTETSAPVAAIQDPAIRQRFTEVIGTYLSRAPFPTGSDPSRVP